MAIAPSPRLCGLRLAHGVKVTLERSSGESLREEVRTLVRSLEERFHSLTAFYRTVATWPYVLTWDIYLILMVTQKSLHDFLFIPEDNSSGFSGKSP